MRADLVPLAMLSLIAGFYVGFNRREIWTRVSEWWRR